MAEVIKKFTAVLLIISVLFFATLTILSIWDIIQVEKLFRKSAWTFVVLLFSSIIILFIYSNFFKDKKNLEN